jgi:hypothetical protein
MNQSTCSDGFTFGPLLECSVAVHKELLRPPIGALSLAKELSPVPFSGSPKGSRWRCAKGKETDGDGAIESYYGIRNVK